MRYKITLNMPSRRGASIHQILCEHEAPTIREFMHQWRDDGFIVVLEYYNQDDGSIAPHDDIGLTYMIGAKVAYMDAEE